MAKIGRYIAIIIVGQAAMLIKTPLIPTTLLRRRLLEKNRMTMKIAMGKAQKSQ